MCTTLCKTMCHFINNVSIESIIPSGPLTIQFWLISSKALEKFKSKKVGPFSKSQGTFGFVLSLQSKRALLSYVTVAFPASADAFYKERKRKGLLASQQINLEAAEPSPRKKCICDFSMQTLVKVFRALALGLAISQLTLANPDAKRLYDDLLSNYNK